MRLSDGRLCKRCCGLEMMVGRNGGQSPMYLKILKCRSSCKMLDGGYVMRPIAETDSRKVYLSRFMTNLLGGKSILMDAYDPILNSSNVRLSSCFIPSRTG